MLEETIISRYKCLCEYYTVIFMSTILNYLCINDLSLSLTIFYFITMIKLVLTVTNNNGDLM